MYPFLQKRKQTPRERFPVSGHAGVDPKATVGRACALPSSSTLLEQSLSMMPTQDMPTGKVHGHANSVAVEETTGRCLKAAARQQLQRRPMRGHRGQGALPQGLNASATISGRRGS